MNEKIDLSRYEGHTPGPWHYEMPPEEGMVIKAGNSHVAELSFLMSNMSPYTDDVNPTGLDPDAVDARLIADAPLLLEEVKRLHERLMLAESALGEVRAYYESGQGDLGEILEHYRDKEGVEMPNAFDEVTE